MRTLKLIALAAITLCLASPLALGQDNAPPNSQLDELIAAQRYEEAYALATSELETWEGDTEFDFLYGIAAIESGYANESVYAFERVANTAPRNATRQRARLELARAHLLTNNLAASESLFNEVLASNPPANVRDNIRAFLNLLEERRSSRKATFSFAVAPVIGHDDNVNSATSNGLIDTPLIGEIELNSEGLKTVDDFMDITANLAYIKPYSRDRSLSLSLIANRHDNETTDQFDIDYGLADISYGYGDEKHRFRHSLQVQSVYLDGERFQNTYRLNNSWQRAGNDGWYQGVSGALSTTRNVNTFQSPLSELKDTNQLLISGTLTKLSANFTNTLTLFYAKDTALATRGEHNGRNYYGLAHSVLWRLNGTNTPYARLSYQSTEYDAKHPIFFNDVRDDGNVSATLGWTWQYSRRLAVNTEMAYNDTSSNISLFEYTRFKYQLGLQFQM
jgi:hypothetical protein